MGRPLFWPKTKHIENQKPNPSRETVPLKFWVIVYFCVSDFQTKKNQLLKTQLSLFTM